MQKSFNQVDGLIDQLYFGRPICSASFIGQEVEKIYILIFSGEPWSWICEWYWKTGNL